MQGLWRLLSRIKDYRKNFVLSILSNILTSIFTVVSIPLLIPFFQILFDRVPLSTEPVVTSDMNGWIKYHMAALIQSQGKEWALFYVCALLILVFFIKNIFRYAALYFLAPLRYGIIYDLRKQLYQKYTELPLSFYSNERKGMLLSGMTVDVQEVEWSVINVIEIIFKAPIIMIGSIIFMFYISASLTLFVFILVIFAALVLGRVVSNLKNESIDVQEAIGNLMVQVEETLGGLRIVKAFNAENYQKSKFDKENSLFRTKLIKVVNKRDMAAPVSEFLGVTVVTILMWYGAHLVFKTSMAPETFFAFVFAFYQVIEPAKSFSSAYFSIQKGMAALDKVNKVLDTPNDITSMPNAIRKANFNEEIRFQQVYFNYKDTSTNVLSDINICIKKGQVAALVGASGAGKSTMVDLLPRFYDPTSGVILLDGVDIKAIDLSDLRGLFGIVSQDPILFHDSILNNITFGSQKYTIDQVEAAAKVANAHDFISALPDGYHSVIGDRGHKLSGGQRQRLTIARAVLYDPPILILDEATSSLDAESERLVQDALAKVTRNRTSIIIAHRLSTIQEADSIFVLDAGKIIQQGTHHSLISIDGEYKKFVQMQTFQ